MLTRLLQLRREGHVSQVRLAQLAAVPRWRIQAAEAGEAELSPEEFRAVRRALVEESRRRLEALEQAGVGA